MFKTILLWTPIIGYVYYVYLCIQMIVETVKCTFNIDKYSFLYTMNIWWTLVQGVGIAIILKLFM